MSSSSRSQPIVGWPLLLMWLVTRSSRSRFGTPLLFWLAVSWAPGGVAGLRSHDLRSYRRRRSPRGIPLATAVNIPSAAANLSTAQRERLRIAILSDLRRIVDMAHAEFESGYDDPVQKLMLRLVLWLGFYLRLTYDVAADHTIVVCERGDDLVGMVELSMQPRLHTPGPMPPPQWIKRLGGDLSPYLSNLLVTKRCRRRGIGRALVKRCETIVLNDWSRDSLALHFDAKDLRLSRFYQRLGFKFECDPTTRKPLGAMKVDGFDLCYAIKPLLGKDVIRASNPLR